MFHRADSHLVLHIVESHLVKEYKDGSGGYNGNNFVVSGRKVRLRQIRDGVEQPPITSDNNYDFSYQEYRRLQNPVKVYPVSTCLHSLYGGNNTDVF